MSLFEFPQATKAKLFENYIAFDDTKTFAVQIFNEQNKEVDMEVFVSKEEAINFVNRHNGK
mgnify:FL=1